MNDRVLGATKLSSHGDGSGECKMGLVRDINDVGGGSLEALASNLH